MSTNEEFQKTPADARQPQVEDTAICDVCGRFGAVRLGERCLCPDCYETSGSCCPEFGCGEDSDEERRSRGEKGKKP